MSDDDAWHDELMTEALRLAAVAIEVGEAPIAAVIADAGARKIVGRGWNELNAKRDRIAHAEIAAFRDAAGRYDIADARLVLVSTLEPCIMCLAACVESAVERVIWAYPAPADSGAARVDMPASPEAKWPKIVGNVRREDSKKLFEAWLDAHPQKDKQRAYVQQLLASTT